MNGMRKTSYIFILVAAIIWSGCDRTWAFTDEIVNNSSETIDLLVYYDASQSVSDSFHIPSKTSMEVSNNFGIGDDIRQSPCGQVFKTGTYELKISNNKTLVLDVNDQENWTSTSDKGHGSSEKHCVLEINDSDLQ